MLNKSVDQSKLTLSSDKCQTKLKLFNIMSTTDRH